MTEFEQKVGRTVLTVIGLLVVLAVGAAVVWSILADAEMLTAAGGPWMLLVYLIVPTLIGGWWVLGRISEYLDDRHWQREGERVMRGEPRYTADLEGYEADLERYEAHLAARGVRKARGAKPKPSR